ncbi:hypothetical protein AM228_09585 [Planktothricoides sp. SR001]|nr:hypothetical protein AM228_09585 [Planktothricoides sp. SR001]
MAPIKKTQLNKLFTDIAMWFRDDNFMSGIHWMEGFFSKILSLVMIFIIIVSVGDLILVVAKDFLDTPDIFLDKTLFKIFGLFLDILIALEVLENITAYLRKHVVQVELVIVTSLVAVARKIIIFDFSKLKGLDLIGLGLAIFALSISYWIVRNLNRKID